MRGLRHILLLAGLFISLAASAQVGRRFALPSYVDSRTVSAVDDSTYTATIRFGVDQSGNAYRATSVQVGYRILTTAKRMYRIAAFTATGSYTGTATLVEVAPSNGPPTGAGICYQYDGSTGTIPLLPVNSQGITAALAAIIHTHNTAFRQAGSAGGGAGTTDKQTEFFDNLNTGNTVTSARSLPDDLESVRVERGGATQLLGVDYTITNQTFQFIQRDFSHGERVTITF